MMGISMLGAFEIALPSSLQSKLQGGGPRTGTVRAAGAGHDLGPGDGSVRGTGDRGAAGVGLADAAICFYGWSLLFVFSLGLGVLFLVIGTFAGAIKASAAGRRVDGRRQARLRLDSAGGARSICCGWRFPNPIIRWRGPCCSIVFFGLCRRVRFACPADAGAGARLKKAVTLIVFLVGAIDALPRLRPGPGGLGGERGKERRELDGEQRGAGLGRRQVRRQAGARGRLCRLVRGLRRTGREDLHRCRRCVDRVDAFVRLEARLHEGDAVGQGDEDRSTRLRACRP